MAAFTASAAIFSPWTPFSAAQERVRDSAIGEKVRDDFYAGFRGDAARLDRTMKTCDDALVANPSDAPALAWRGGGFLFLGAQALRRGEPAKGSELYAKGLQQMQSALDLGPNNISVRIIRGATLQDAARRSPGPAEAEQLMRTALEDYEKTLSRQEPYFDRVPAHGRGELLLGLADGYSRTGDRGTAAAFFERIRKELPGSAYAQSASQWLETRTPLPIKQAGCLGCHQGN